MRKLKIRSNGLPNGTEIIDAETGEALLLPLTAITWEVLGNGAPTATLTVECVEAEILTDNKALMRAMSDFFEEAADA